MKTQNFTPGPWEPEYKTAYQHNVVSHTTPKTIVCTCDVPEYGSKRANFMLIAAAPELFETLEELLFMEVKGHALIDRLQFSTEGRRIADKARVALAKAKGEK